MLSSARLEAPARARRRGPRAPGRLPRRAPGAHGRGAVARAPRVLPRPGRARRRRPARAAGARLRAQRPGGARAAGGRRAALDATGCVEHHGRAAARRVRARGELAGPARARRAARARRLPGRAARAAVRDPATACRSRSTSRLNARFLPNGTRACGSCGGASRTPTRSCAPRTTATRGPATRATSARRPRATCWRYLQSASRPPLLRATLAVAVAAEDPDELERRVRGLPAGVRRDRACTARSASSSSSSASTSPASPRARAATRTPSRVEQVAAMMPTAGHPVGSRRGLVPRPHADRRAPAGALRPARGLAHRPPDDGAQPSARWARARRSSPRRCSTTPSWPGRGSSTPTPRATTASTCSTRSRRTSRRSRCAPTRRCAGLLDPLRVAPEHLRHDAAVSFLQRPAARARRRRLADRDRRAPSTPSCARAGPPTCGEVVRALDEGDAVDEQVAQHARASTRARG